jgi:hypothetical protein
VRALRIVQLPCDAVTAMQPRRQLDGTSQALMHLPERALLRRRAWPGQNGDQVEVTAPRLVVTSGEGSMRPHCGQRQCRLYGSYEAVGKATGGITPHEISVHHTRGAGSLVGRATSLVARPVFD